MNQSKTFHISSLWFGFFTFGAFMCILCFRWWYVGWPKHGSIGRVLFQTLERQFMTVDAIAKMFAVWHCFIAPVPFSRKSVRFCRAQVDCHLEQRWNMQSWKRYVHFSLVVRSAWAPVKNVDTIYWKTSRMIFMLLMHNFVDHVSFVFHRIETLWEPFLKTMSFDIWPFWPLPGASPSVGDGCHRSGPRQQSRLDVDGFPGSGQRSDQCRLDGHRCAAILIFFSRIFCHGFSDWKFNFSKLPKAQPNFVHFPGLHAMNGVKENLMIGKAVSVGSSLVLKKAKEFQSLYFLW